MRQEVQSIRLSAELRALIGAQGKLSPALKALALLGLAALGQELGSVEAELDELRGNHELSPALRALLKALPASGTTTVVPQYYRAVEASPEPAAQAPEPAVELALGDDDDPFNVGYNV